VWDHQQVSPKGDMVRGVGEREGKGQMSGTKQGYTGWFLPLRVRFVCAIVDKRGTHRKRGTKNGNKKGKNEDMFGEGTGPGAMSKKERKKAFFGRRKVRGRKN